MAMLSTALWLVGTMLLFVWLGTRLVTAQGGLRVPQNAGGYRWVGLFLGMIASGYFLSLIS